MKLTRKLFTWVHRAFSKDPKATLALRLDYDGAMTWTVADGFLTTTVTGGSGAALNIDLSLYTLAALATHLAAQTGYTVAFSPPDSIAQLSALSILDGSNTPAVSNGDHLSIFTSLAWAFLDSSASELNQAVNSIPLMIDQMVVGTAEGTWLDYHGSFFDCVRQNSELDPQYAGRIVTQMFQPKANNVAIELALQSLNSGQLATITDAPLVSGNYGWFDAEIDTAGVTDIASLIIRSRALIDQFRDAGTNLRNFYTSISTTDRFVSTAVSQLGVTISVGP